MFRNRTWAQTIKKVREPESKMELGEDPVVQDNRGRYPPEYQADRHLTDTNISARQQAARHQQEIVDIWRKLNEAEAREKTSYRKLT